MPARSGTYIEYYRWKWHSSSPPQPRRGQRRLTGSGDGCGCASIRSGDYVDRLVSVGLVWPIGFRALVAAEWVVTHTPTSGADRGQRWGARPLAACLPAPSSAEMPTPGWSRTTRSRTWAGRRPGATSSTSATGRTSTVKLSRLYILHKLGFIVEGGVVLTEKYCSNVWVLYFYKKMTNPTKHCGKWATESVKVVLDCH